MLWRISHFVWKASTISLNTRVVPCGPSRLIGPPGILTKYFKMNHKLRKQWDFRGKQSFDSVTDLVCESVIWRHCFMIYHFYEFMIHGHMCSRLTLAATIRITVAAYNKMPICCRNMFEDDPDNKILKNMLVKNSNRAALIGRQHSNVCVVACVCVQRLRVCAWHIKINLWTWAGLVRTRLLSVRVAARVQLCVPVSVFIRFLGFDLLRAGRRLLRPDPDNTAATS